MNALKLVLVVFWRISFELLNSIQHLTTPTTKFVQFNTLVFYVLEPVDSILMGEKQRELFAGTSR